MDEGTTFVALDDSKRKVVVAIWRPGASEPEQRELPKEPHLIRRLSQRLTREGPVHVCYEAGVSGYDLYRQITACGVACQVMAPALTPRRPGQRIKTDRRDAVKLVRRFRAGELTPIPVPNAAEEAVRDLVRCREDIRRDVLRWRHRLLKFLPAYISLIRRRRRLILRCAWPPSGTLSQRTDPIRQRRCLTVGPSISAIARRLPMSTQAATPMAIPEPGELVYDRVPSRSPGRDLPETQNGDRREGQPFIRTVLRWATVDPRRSWWQPATMRMRTRASPPRIFPSDAST